jgi:hypothetical protein
MAKADPLTRICAVCDQEGSSALKHRGVTLCWLCSDCVETGVENLISQSGEQIADAHESEKISQVPAVGGTSPGTDYGDDNDNYNSDKQKSTDRGIEHACCWREVYCKMDVAVPYDE